ncbi:hypothetical protein [Oceanisphaera ostreae]|uniref:Thioredoxin domain-containing protein n=1 Tax=Oceanisphaera ostreae TaxID=914151 RepID=A0ABW3KFX4_9GAMM
MMERKTSNFRNKSQPSHHAHPGQQIRSRKVLLAMLAVFLLPVALAWLTLTQGWFTPAVNSHGEWVQGQIAADNQWRLILPTSPDCDACLRVEPLLNNIDTALGRDGDRVAVVRLPTSNELEAGYVYIADPPGLLIMRYVLPSSKSGVEFDVNKQQEQEREQEQAKMGKALLSDLRRLLKYSRAG